VEELARDYQLPEAIEEKMTKHFLERFKKKLDERFKLDEDEEEPTFLNTYIYLPETQGWKESFKKVCFEENKQDVFEHYEELTWYNKESFDDFLGQKMLEQQVIQMGQDETIENIW
jgi:hypothetical protein